MSTRKQQSRIDAFMSLPDVEKERIFREFDKENIADTFRPLGQDQQRLWAKAKSRLATRAKAKTKPAPPTRTVSLRLDRELLKRADAKARSQGVSRTEFIAHALLTSLG